MNLPKFRATGVLAIAGLIWATNACSAETRAHKQAVAKPPKQTTAAVAPVKQSLEIKATKSVFAVPTTQEEGRNPFFPQARVTAQVPKEKEQSLEPSAFVLNGITGPPLRSAMINGRTFLAGEEGEVRLQNGAKIMIKCADIRDESATIVVGGIRRELRLRLGI